MIVLDVEKKADAKKAKADVRRIRPIYAEISSIKIMTQIQTVNILETPNSLRKI